MGVGFQGNAFQTGFQIGGLVVDPGPTVITFLPVSSNKSVPELTDYYASLTFLDIFGVSYIPTALSWRVYDETNKVQLQDWVALNPAAQITLDIPAAYNAMGNSRNLQEWRLIILHITAPGGATRYDYAAYSVVSIEDIP